MALPGVRCEPCSLAELLCDLSYTQSLQLKTFALLELSAEEINE